LKLSLTKQREVIVGEELLHGELATVRETLATVRTKLREAKRLTNAAERREEGLRKRLKAAQEKLEELAAPEVIASLVAAQVAETVAELETTKAGLAKAKLTRAEVLENIAKVRKELLKLIAKSPASLIKLKQQLEALQAENEALRARLGEA
jgi:chromosome segregation ATPase